ncbi:ATP-binding protein [Amycolatopsis saalfeldensis]|uniref:Tetratricopeptide repeat-containing protein n=1 Tax=Amycolatopsis saalfeldensis TaxID=394193 RepID=A0A1H8YNN9_9PSEU|nr:tetratricopeptide repeat protein [Amycolatopsis saalfeldensis]SEP53814.1 Tetratricopeptide repeat-containing protein [Amycolatopsis saalfeldensis]
MGASGDTAPSPDQAVDLAEFISLLGKLRAWAGQPSYRSLAKRVGPLLRPAQVVSPSTLVDAFKPGRRRLDIDLVVAIVKALGLDEAAVSRWRAACIAAHANAKTGPVGVFRQLPADLATFTGRTRELAQLMDAVAEDGPRTVVVSAIEGMAGVGKTRLAVHAAHELVRAGRCTDVQLYVDLRGFDAELSPADPGAVLDGFLRQLGVAAQRIPDGLDQRAAMFRDRLEGKNALILLDNAADDRQVRDLIPASPTCLVLITSRRTLAALEGASFHLLDVLAPPDALDLLARIAGADRVAAESSSAKQIVEACGYLPLAVSLAASRLRSRPAWRLADFAERIGEAGLVSASVGRRSVRAVFDLSVAGLEDPLRRFFLAAGLFPGGDFTAQAAAALADVGVGAARQMLEQLQDEHLLQQNTPARYAFHDLLRTYARELASEESAGYTDLGALTRLFDHYRYTTAVAMDLIEPATRERRPRVTRPDTEAQEFADRAEALGWLQTERPNLLAVAARAASCGLAAHVSQFSHIAWRFLHDHGHHRDALELHALAVTVTRASGDRRGLTNALRFSGLAYERLGMLQEALAAFEQARTLCEDPGDLAAILEGLGNVNVLMCRYARAAEYFDQALALWQSLGRMLGIGNNLGNLGITTFHLGRYGTAHDYLLRALAVHEDHGYPTSQTQALIWLGIVGERTGNHVGAAEHLNRALELAQTHGLPGFESDALEVRGRVRLAQGHSDQALADLLRSLEIRGQHLNQPNMCNSLLALGALYQRQREYDRALDHLGRALETARDVGTPAGECAALTGLGEALAALGKTSSALDHHRRALELARKVGDPYWLARTREGLGAALCTDGHESQGVRQLRIAHDSYNRIGVPDAERVEAHLTERQGRLRSG